MKRVVVIADLHCGHRAGLTPPEFQYDPENEEHIWQKFGLVQQLLWDFYTKIIESLKPVDLLIVNGDCVDGKGGKAGGTEQITADRKIQVDMAVKAIDFVSAKQIIMTYGTSYHTGDDEDWEDLVADKVGAKIGSHEWVDVNGCIFDIRHHVGRSAVPYGRLTAPLREQLWSYLWAEMAGYPKSDVIVRSHVHYHVDGQVFGKRAFTTPCLQLHTKYGSRRATGTVDVGLLNFDVDDTGGYIWKAHLLELCKVAAHPLKV